MPDPSGALGNLQSEVEEAGIHAFTQEEPRTMSRVHGVARGWVAKQRLWGVERWGRVGWGGGALSLQEASRQMILPAKVGLNHRLQG